MLATLMNIADIKNIKNGAVLIVWNDGTTTSGCVGELNSGEKYFVSSDWRTSDCSGIAEELFHYIGVIEKIIHLI